MSDYSISAKITGDASGFTTAITKATESLKELGKKVADSTSKISEGAKDWGLDLEKFYDKGSSIFKSFGVDIDQFASHFGVSGALVAGITAVTVALQKLGAEMNEASAEIVKGTGATGEALIQLKDDMNAALVGGMSQDIKTVGTMIADINTRFGSTGEELTKLTDRFGDFSVITGTDAKTAINSVADATKKWGLSNEEVLPLLDQLTVASQASGASVSELLSGLKTGQAVFSQFGMSATESVALLSSLSASGVDTSTALTGLRTALANFSKEGINAKTGLEEVSNAIRNASTESEALNIAVETFGTKSGAEFVNILKSGTDSADAFMEAMLKAGGAVEQTAEAARTSKQAMTELLNSLKSTFSGFGEGVDNLLTDILDSFRNLVELVAPVIQPIGKIFNDVFSYIGELVKTLAGYFVEFQKRFNTTWNGVAEILQTTYEAIHKILGNVLQVVGDVFGMIFAIIDGKWEVAWLYAKRVLLTFADNLAGIMSWIVNIVAKGINLVIKPINGLIDGFNKVIETLNYIPGVSIPAAKKLQELGEVDFSDSWGITEALETVTKEIDDATGKSAETITANLGEVKTVSTEIAETVSAEWENAFKTMEASSVSWEDKYLTQQIKLEKQALERAVELAKIEGKSEAEIFQIKKEGQDKINKLLEEQIDREKEKELAKIAEIEKITGVTEDTEALRQKIEEYYTNERKQLYADDLSSFRKAHGEKAEIVEETEVKSTEKAVEAKKEDYTWTIRLLEQDKARAKTDREKNDIQAEIYRLQKLQALATADVNDYAKIELYYDTLINEALKEIKENIDKASEAQELFNEKTEFKGNGSKSEEADARLDEERFLRLEKIAEMQVKWDDKLLAQKISRAEAEKQLDEESYEAQAYHIDKILALKQEQLERERAAALAGIDDTEENAELRLSIEKYYDNASVQLYRDSLVEKNKYRLNEETEEQKAREEAEKKNKAMWSNILGYAKTAMSGMSKLVSGIKNIFKGVVDGVKRAWSGFVGFLDFSPDDALIGLLEFEDKVLTFFLETLPKLPSFLSSAIDSIAVMFETIFKTVDFKAMFKTLSNGFKNILKKIPPLIKQYMPDIIEVFQSLASGFLDVLPSLISTAGTLVTALMNEIPKFVVTLLPKLSKTLSEILPQIFEKGGALVKSVVDMIPSFVKSLIDGFVLLLDKPDVIMEIVKSLLNGIAEVIKYLASHIGEIVQKLIPLLAEIVFELIKSLPEIFGEMVHGTLNAVGGAIKGVGDVIKNVGAKVGGFFKDLFTGKLFADGTNSAPRGLAIVGEAGPELVKFNGGEQVINNRNTQKILSDSGKGSVTINNAFYNTADTSAYQIMRQLNQQRRELAFNGVL